MRLSEAIRLGAMMRPQTFGALSDERGTCAMGAAYEAAGLKLSHDVNVVVGDIFSLVETLPLVLLVPENGSSTARPVPRTFTARWGS